MSVKLLWSDQAIRRLEEIGDFIAERDPTAAGRVVESILARVEVLAEHPRVGVVFPSSPTDNVRIMYFERYRVYYVFQEAERCVTVLTVRHGREAPLSLERATDENEP